MVQFAIFLFFRNLKKKKKKDYYGLDFSDFPLFPAWAPDCSHLQEPWNQKYLLHCCNAQAVEPEPRKDFIVKVVEIIFLQKKVWKT